MKSLVIHARISFKRCIYFAIAIILASCGNSSQNTDQEQPINVDFLEVKPTSAIIEKKYPGSIEGSVNVEIKSQVTGYLDYIYVNEGDYVKEGQSLFKIRDDVFSEQVKNGIALLEAAIAAQNNARLEVEKIKPLVVAKVVSEMQLKTAEANYESATAQVNQAKANLSSAKISASFCIIKAPVNGYMGRIPFRIGNLISPSDATPLSTLSEIDNVFVYFSLSEVEYLDYLNDSKNNKLPYTVELIMANNIRFNQKGQLSAASGNIDKVTGSMSMKAVFPNPDKTLRSGGFARVVLKKTYNSVFLIPMSSVKDIQDKYFVFILTGSNNVTMRPIEINGQTGNYYIVKAGLKPGDRFAANCIDILSENTIVKPNTAVSNL